MKAFDWLEPNHFKSFILKGKGVFHFLVIPPGNVNLINFYNKTVNTINFYKMTQ